MNPNSMTHANEYTLVEKPILDRLRAYGYRYIHPDEHPILRSRENEVLFKSLLVAALVRINGILKDTAEAIIGPDLLAGQDGAQEGTAGTGPPHHPEHQSRRVAKADPVGGGALRGALLRQALMHLTIGDTVIPYEVRESNKATRKKIVVTPAGVEVVVPAGTPVDSPEGVISYVQRKRRWVFDSLREVERKHHSLLIQQYASGAKLQYRGRWLMLDVQAGDVSEVMITSRSKFHVVVPVGLDGVEKLETIRKAFDRWLRERALDEVERFGHHHEATLGVYATGYRLSDARSRWGSCGQD
ncbi:conserved hypothetical protein [Gammaproteobacteria bacterium]